MSNVNYLDLIKDKKKCNLLSLFAPYIEWYAELAARPVEFKTEHDVVRSGNVEDFLLDHLNKVEIRLLYSSLADEQLGVVESKGTDTLNLKSDEWSSYIWEKLQQSEIDALNTDGSVVTFLLTGFDESNKSLLCSGHLDAILPGARLFIKGTSKIRRPSIHSECKKLGNALRSSLSELDTVDIDGMLILANSKTSSKLPQLHEVTIVEACKDNHVYCISKDAIKILQNTASPRLTVSQEGSNVNITSDFLVYIDGSKRSFIAYVE